MKTATLREAKEQLSHYVNQAQKDFLLITKHGRPAVLVRGVSGYDMEDIFYMTNREFWKTIRKRRKQKPISWAKARLSV